jgi:nitroimidazol reductase NimA-like FMN-containing flavoprotein (pyridoxamine 5'-phosphate oxidase superfamily)
MKKLILTTMILGIAAAFVLGSSAGAAEKKNEKAKAQQIDAAASGLSANHPEIPEGVSCNDCHEVKLDANTTATQAWLQGPYLKYAAGQGVMPQDQLKAEIAKIMGGKKQKKTCVLGTSLNNVPLTTTADFAFDNNTMILYGLHEKGTTKLLHIKQNPKVSLNWHEEFKTWGTVLCAQFIGTAELLDGTNPEFEKVLVDIYPYEELSKNMKIEPQQAREMIKKGMLLSKITVNQITINNSAFEKNGMRKYQRWVRPAK